MTEGGLSRTRTPIRSRARLRAAAFSLLMLVIVGALLCLASNQQGAIDRTAGSRLDQSAWQSAIQIASGGTASREETRPSAPRRLPLARDTQPDNDGSVVLRHLEPSLPADASPSDDSIADASTQDLQNLAGEPTPKPPEASGSEAKLDSALRQAVASGSTPPHRVIVQARWSQASARQAVADIGGQVYAAHRSIGAVAAIVSGADLERLARHPDVARLSVDAVIAPQDEDDEDKSLTPGEILYKTNGLKRGGGLESGGSSYAGDEIRALEAAGLLHDLGKLAVPDYILNKPGKLKPAEFDLMKKHASVGGKLLSMIQFPYPVVPIVRHHHEQWDGGGYPDGLRGEGIPLGARILAVVDCFDALTSDRPYRRKLSDDAALNYLQSERGKRYDPRIVDRFVELCPTLPRTGEKSVCTLYCYDSSKAQLEAAYVSRADYAFIRAVRMPLGERLSGWVGASRQTIVNSDPVLDLGELVRLRKPTLRTCLSTALVSDDTLAGVLTLYSSDGAGFREEQTRRVEHLAPVIAEFVRRSASLSSGGCLDAPSDLRVDAEPRTKLVSRSLVSSTTTLSDSQRRIPLKIVGEF